MLGAFGCPAKFRYRKQSNHDGREDDDDDRHELDGARASGTAVHEVLRHIISEGRTPIGYTDHALGAFWDAEMLRQVPSSVGRGFDSFHWSSITSFESEREAAIAMLHGGLRIAGAGSVEPLLAEACFIAPLPSGLWIEGHVDLIFQRRKTRCLGMLDWKTGKQLPHPIELQHGWEAAIYSAALARGIFVPYYVVDDVRTSGLVRDELTDEQVAGILAAPSYRDAAHSLVRSLARSHWEDGEALPGYVRVFGRHPSETYHVHLRDFVPYKRGGSKRVDRAEHLRFYQRAEPGNVSYAAGEQRGPGAYEIFRSENDNFRLDHQLRQVVASVRMGHFPAAIGQACVRCPFKQPCFTAGYEAKGDDAKQMVADLKGFDALSSDLEG